MRAEQENRSGESAADFIEGRLLVSWVSKKGDGGQTHRSIIIKAQLTYEEALVLLPLDGVLARNRLTLLKMFSTALAKWYGGDIEAKNAGGRISGKFDSTAFERIVSGLEQRGWVTRVPPPGYVKQTGNYWRLTARGLQLKSELQSRGQKE